MNKNMFWENLVRWHYFKPQINGGFLRASLGLPVGKLWQFTRYFNLNMSNFFTELKSSQLILHHKTLQLARNTSLYNPSMCCTSSCTNFVVLQRDREQMSRKPKTRFQFVTMQWTTSDRNSSLCSVLMFIISSAPPFTQHTGQFSTPNDRS